MKGTRAIWLAVVVVVLSAILAYLLQDGGVFTAATSTSVVGKFLYDSARDVSGAQSPPPASPGEEYGD